MSQKIYRPSTYRANRRQFLQLMGAGVASAALLSACAPAGAPASGTTASSGSSASAGTHSEWVTGKVPSDTSAPFNYSSWEGEEEMRKWLLHFDNFFKTNYPKMQVHGDWGIDWNEYWTKMPTQLAAGAKIDLMWMHDSRVQTFANNGWLLPLDDYLAAFPALGWPQDFYPSQVKSFQYQGKQYGFPYDFASGGLYLNLDMFDKAGVKPPDENTTWDDFVGLAKSLTIKDGDKTTQWGVTGLPTNDANNAYIVVKCFGGDYWDEAITKSKFDQPETIAAFQYLADLIWKHGVMPSADMLQGLSMAGDLAFSSGLSAMHYTLNDEAFVLAETINKKFKWGFAPTPKGPAGQFYFVGGSSFAIPKSSTQPDIAYELIRWTLSNPDNLKVSGQMGSQFTGNVKYYEYGLPKDEWGVDKEAFKKTFYDLPRQHGTLPSYHPKYLEWETSVYATYMDPLWTGDQRDASVACAQVHDATNKLLSGS